MPGSLLPSWGVGRFLKGKIMICPDCSDQVDITFHDLVDPEFVAQCQGCKARWTMDSKEEIEDYALEE